MSERMQYLGLVIVIAGKNPVEAGYVVVTLNFYIQCPGRKSYFVWDFSPT